MLRSLALQHAADAVDAINRVEAGDQPDVVVLDPGLADPVRVAQRMHSLDRDGAVVVLAEAAGHGDLAHALSIAPFLSGDVTLLAMDTEPVAFVEHVAAAAERTRMRREEAAERKKRRATPPPLNASYLGTLLDSVPIGLVTMDETAAVIGWNRRAGEMLAVSEVDALGMPFAELFAQDDRPRLAALIEQFGAAGISDETDLFERGGRTFELSGARFSIRSGEPGTLLILQDVTTRMLAEREVELQRALMAAQADSSMLGIAVVTLDGRLERMNKRWTEIWGIDGDLVRTDRERATQLMLDQVIDPEEFMAGIRRLAESNGGEYSDEIELKDGRVIERYATHVKSEAGEPIGRIWFHTDITAHRREEERLRLLADATNLLSSSLDYEVTLRSVVDLAVPRLADWCSIETVESGGVMKGLVGRAVDTGESQVFKVLTDEQLVAFEQDDEYRELVELSPRSVMVVPVKIRDRVFGAISLIRSGSSQPYDEDDIRLAEELARRAAIAIDNSRVHVELRETARTLQESLLPPHLPAVRGLELAARFRPAGAGVQVGGDFYDIFETSPDQWGVVVGDVCGKGAEAAALTALTRYTVRAAAMYEDQAGGVLRVLNEALLRQRGDYQFTTLAYCVVDLTSEPRSLRVAAGGHPPPLLLRADGTTEAVPVAGPLLGVTHDVKFTDRTLEFGEGDVLVLYTDGLTDALAPEQMLDEADLLAALADCKGLSAGEISQRLEDVALGEDPTRTPRDDIALVVVKLV